MTKQRKKFNKEVGSFVTTTAIMFFINAMTSPRYWWFIWVTGFWGAALLGKYIVMELNGDEEEEDDFEELELEPLEYHETSQPTRRNWREKDLV